MVMFLVDAMRTKSVPSAGSAGVLACWLPLTYPREVCVWWSLCMVIWNLTALSWCVGLHTWCCWVYSLNSLAI